MSRYPGRRGRSNPGRWGSLAFSPLRCDRLLSALWDPPLQPWRWAREQVGRWKLRECKNSTSWSGGNVLLLLKASQGFTTLHSIAGARCIKPQTQPHVVHDCVHVGEWSTVLSRSLWCEGNNGVRTAFWFVFLVASIRVLYCVNLHSK